MLSNNSSTTTYSPFDDLLEDTSSSKSSLIPSEDDLNQDDGDEDGNENEIVRSSSLSLSEQTRSSYSGPRMRLQKTMSCKTLSELELEEVKGFMDLGFKFNKETLSPITMNIIPGLQSLTRPKKDKAQDEAQLDNDDIYEEDDDDLEENDRGVLRPYLSESWLIKRPDSPLLNLKLPREYATADMKKHLRYWARTVASVIQQEL